MRLREDNGINEADWLNLWLQESYQHQTTKLSYAQIIQRNKEQPGEHLNDTRPEVQLDSRAPPSGSSGGGVGSSANSTPITHQASSSPTSFSGENSIPPRGGGVGGGRHMRGGGRGRGGRDGRNSNTNRNFHGPDHPADRAKDRYRSNHAETSGRRWACDQTPPSDIGVRLDKWLPVSGLVDSTTIVITTA